MLILVTKPLSRKSPISEMSESSIADVGHPSACNALPVLSPLDVSEHVVCVVTALRQNRHQRVSGWGGEM